MKTSTKGQFKQQLVAAADLGKATARLLLGRVAADGSLSVDSSRVVAHEGRPLEAFADWYREVDASAAVALAATGLHGAELLAPVLAGLPEDACLEAALPLLTDFDGPLNLVRVGARGYSVLTRDLVGRVTHVENDKCSSGTGETMVKIAGRFGLTLEDADRLASEAAESIPVTARCSVFAKSEMTHFGNQGRPANQLFRGYFESVARHVAALLARARVEGPVLLTGGCARVESFVRALELAADCDVVVPAEAQTLEALGALRLAADQALAEKLAPLPQDPAGLIMPRERRIEALTPAAGSRSQVTRMEVPPVPAGALAGPTILGLDLGSTGSKAVLTSLEDGAVVHDLYDRTRGNPVEAMQRLIGELLAEPELDLRAIGLTGSGREAAAAVLRAALPEAGDRIIVINEIVAHATAAMRCDPDGGQSLSIVEIGGQDAKFVQVAGGRVVESDMNKACSAGTGSFLEEQAVFYGLDDIRDFSGIAEQATRPADLGQMCTVFVADAAAEALAEGFEVPDIFAGFQYSVIHNYIHRVMGQRSLGERIFFQGKPATSPTLAWTLAAVTGREVWVPPNPGAMGAWGIGLCAREELASLGEAAALDLTAVLDAAIVESTEFRCKDKRCDTYCVIERTTVAVGDAQTKVMSGGACPKYEVSSKSQPKLDREAPSAFEERAALLEKLAPERHGQTVIGVPVVGALQAVMPWLTTLIAELGFGVKVLHPDGGSLSKGEERCYSFDACAPVKVAHGVADADVDQVFFPKLLNLPDRDGPAAKTCPMEQGLPDMIQEALRARGSDIELLRPVTSLGRGYQHPLLLAELLPFARRLGVGPARLAIAIRRAALAQRRYEAELAEIGQRSLRYARENELAVVVVTGALHVMHDPSINARIPALLRQHGVMAIPMDAYPIPDAIAALPRVVWTDSNRSMRVALACRERGDAFPLLLTSFGCGPFSFVEQIFSRVMDGYPHSTLETDGHGGTAGYVTRIQAFLHTVRQHDGLPSPASADRLSILEPLPMPSIDDERGSKLVMMALGEGLGAIGAAYYRSHGFDATVSAPNTAAAMARGRQDCSGKECLPYQLIWGSFKQQLTQDPPERRTVLFQAAGQGMCRNCMFSIKDQMSLERMGLRDRVAMRHMQPEPEFGTGFATRYWGGVVCWDIFSQLRAYTRAGERVPGSADALYSRSMAAVVALVEEPEKPRLARLPDRARWWKKLNAALENACRDFALLGAGDDAAATRQTVLLTGDIYLRLDAFGNDDLSRRLNDRGLRVLLDPANVLVEYMAAERSAELTGLPTERAKNVVIKVLLAGVRRRLYDRARKHHPWLPMPDVRALREYAAEVIDRYPVGEAPLAVGTVLQHWAEQYCDGAVIAGPWGCGPSLIAESLLRHRRDIPQLFIYHDGTPLDDRRLDAFAFRLRRQQTAGSAAVGR